MQAGNRIKGALYGFVIGDALGATTALKDKSEIRKVKNIQGGGWLNLKAGQVTDASQSMFCVIDALLEMSPGEFDITSFEYHVRNQLMLWLYSNPIDMGKVTKQGIIEISEGREAVRDRNVLSSGGFIRALPLALLGPSYEEWNTLQGRLTHFNIKSSIIIQDYSRLIFALIHGNIYKLPNTALRGQMEASDNVVNTFNNSIYWMGKRNLEESILGAVNEGGISNRIAAITGSIVGARDGVDRIPKRWINAIDGEVKDKIEKYIRFVQKNIHLQ